MATSKYPTPPPSSATSPVGGYTAAELSLAEKLTVVGKASLLPLYTKLQRNELETQTLKWAVQCLESSHPTTSLKSVVEEVGLALIFKLGCPPDSMRETEFVVRQQHNPYSQSIADFFSDGQRKKGT